jgi:hypothetical protein
MAAIQGCAEKLGHVPSRVELAKHTGLTRHEVNRYFGNYRSALEECKLEATGAGIKVEAPRLFEEWTRVVRALKKLPTLYEFEHESRYSVRPFRRRFGKWSEAPEGMKRYALEHGLTDGWQDVMELIDSQAEGLATGQNDGGEGPAVRREGKILTGRPMYGTVIRPFPMICAPTNEFGVIFVFGALAEKLGLLVLRLQGRYPDGEAFRVVGENRLQRVKIEFELQSRNFLWHHHDERKCDLIVCWEHNWPEAPMEVIELRKFIG